MHVYSETRYKLNAKSLQLNTVTTDTTDASTARRQDTSTNTHRLGVDRMHGKQHPGQRGKVAPQSGDRDADAREQRTGDGVQQHIGDVKPAGVAAEQRVIQPVAVSRRAKRKDWHCYRVQLDDGKSGYLDRFRINK